MAKKKPESVFKRRSPFGSLLYVLFGPATSSNARSWIFLILIILALRWAWFEPYKIPSGSMEPTLMGDPSFFAGDRVFINKHHYGLRVPFMNKYIFRRNDPQRWDIVVFKAAHENPEHKTLIKRIVGLPGERIHIGQDGEIYVNGERVDPPEELRDVLHYTRGIAIPMEAKKETIAELAQIRGTSPFFQYWDDLSKQALIVSALTGSFSEVLSENPDQSDVIENEIERIRKTAASKNIATMQDAIRLKLDESVSPEGLKAAKTSLINSQAPLIGIKPDPASLLYDQEAVDRLYADVKDIQQGAKTLDDCAESSYAIVEALYRMRQPIDYRYGIREEDEFSVIPPDHYMMMGDNSGNSVDSRVYGWVPREHIVGRTFAIWWPPRHWRDFTGWTATWWGTLLLYGIPIAFFGAGYWHHAIRRSVRVHDQLDIDGHVPGGKVVVDCTAYGFRWPFVRQRITRGKEPAVGEYVLFTEGHQPLIGTVTGLPDTPIGKGKKRVPEDHYRVNVRLDDAEESFIVPRNKLIGRARAAGGSSHAPETA